MSGILYIVATPIGNMADFSQRAIDTLKQVDLIAAEDTRHSKALLQHYHITTPLTTYHEHNEQAAGDAILQRLIEGNNVALISDAGTPLINDPGYRLVALAREKGIKLVPIPGCSALVAALCVSGLPTNDFFFVGFLPSKSAAKHTRLQQLQSLSTTLIFYEAPHRLLSTLTLLMECYPAQPVVVARELTKKFEQVISHTAEKLLSWFEAHSDQVKGEIVLLVDNRRQKLAEDIDSNTQTMASTLATELPIKTAAKLTAKLTNCNKQAIYDWLVTHK